jgi:hypothetical protein
MLSLPSNRPDLPDQRTVDGGEDGERLSRLLVLSCCLTRLIKLNELSTAELAASCGYRS